MAYSKAVFLAAAMFVLITVSSAAELISGEAPAPSPTSPAAALSPSLVAGVFAAVAALAFGSALRI